MKESMLYYTKGLQRGLQRIRKGVTKNDKVFF